MQVSIIICTLCRKELDDCLESLKAQTFKDYEVILVKEIGALTTLRNEGAKRAKGRYLVFIDDDTVTTEKWLENVVRSFKRDPRIIGCSGPSIIPSNMLSNRDLFRFLGLQTFIFGNSSKPGHILKSGCWSTEASKESCSYEGEVEFLEACNMAFRKDAFDAVGGFDESYKGIGDWSEPDLCFRLRRAEHRLWFSRDARLYHIPSRTRSFKKGESCKERIDNYELFSKRWIKPSISHYCYKLFIRTYYFFKERGWL